MTYKETLHYLYEQLPMFQRVGAPALKKDLTNIQKICAALGHPETTFPTIHIAGTNGKGSTTHLLSSVLQAAGYKTGIYTSPHYKDFRERIKINGTLIPKKTVTAFVQKHRSLLEELQPSFFEITVAMAFDYFAAQQVEIAIIETGLGGRLDSTNIIIPLLSIITNISYDHQQFLGDTLEKIAAEKAGIIKANTPVLIGERQEEVAAVFINKAKECNAPLHFAEEWIQLQTIKVTDTHTHYFVNTNKLLLPDLKVQARGSFQAKNVTTVLAAIELLQLYDYLFENHNVEAYIQKGFANLHQYTGYIGRWQIIGNEPTILCDSAHNEGGLRLVLEDIQSLSYDQLHIVMGGVKDKTLDNILPLFPKNATYYFAKADIPRGLDANELAVAAFPYGLVGKAYTSVGRALAAAKRKASKKDLIFVGGSIFVVAEVI